MNFKELLTKTQTELLDLLPEVIKSYGYSAIITDYAQGYIKDSKAPTLVAHLDTINTHRSSYSYLYTKQPTAHKEIAPMAEDIIFSDKYILLSPEANSSLSCLGADDRVGVKTIIDILDRGLRPNILFTTNEEVGCKGSHAIEENGTFKELDQSPMFIQIDRGVHEGSWNEMVFYNYDYTSISSIYDFLKDHYTLARGSYTDVAVLGSYFNKPIVNLSASYKNEHQRNEFINLEAYASNLNSLYQFLEWIAKQDTSDWKYSEKSTVYNYTGNVYKYNTVSFYIQHIYTGAFIEGYRTVINYTKENPDTYDMVLDNLDLAYCYGYSFDTLEDLKKLLENDEDLINNIRIPN